VRRPPLGRSIFTLAPLAQTAVFWKKNRAAPAWFS
jgi:hypothetical protein